MALLEGRAQRQGLRDQSPQTPRLSGDSLLSGDSILSGGLIWAAICAALLKRFLAHAAQLVGKVAVSTRKTAMMLDQSLPVLLMAVGADPRKKSWNGSTVRFRRSSETGNGATPGARDVPAGRNLA